MTTMTLSEKRQVVLPAELCRQVALSPGARVQVSLAPDGADILIRPAAAPGKKPASALFDRARHRGAPIAIDRLQELVYAPVWLPSIPDSSSSPVERACGLP